jgi:catechol 2,3-dioxygenase-like lactoylglutathione lyase family enzyme
MSERLHHVGLSVADLDIAADWYGSALGFQVEFLFQLPVLRGAMIVNPAGLRLELLERSGSRDSGRATDPNAALLTRGWGHIALEVEDLDETYLRLLAAGASGVWDPRPSPQPGVRMAFLHDPEGNLIELIQRGA